MYGRVLSVLFLVLAETAAFQHSETTRSRPRVRHEARNATSETRKFCDTDELEYRITRLEIQTAEKSENLRSELKESNRRLQALESQSNEIEIALETLKTELGRFTESYQPQYETALSNKLDFKVDNLAKGLQIAIAALKNLNADMSTIKKNLSAITTSTKSLVANHESLVTKPFLSDSLVDVKHHHLMSSGSYRNLQKTEDLPENCKEVQERGNNVSGIYRIQPELSMRPFMVLCDLENKDGGWTYILNRFDGMQDFYLNWHSYKIGFGNLGGEFWLGLEYLHQLTGSQVNELLVELEDYEKMRVYAHYTAFSVGNEAEGYSLKVLGGYNGNAGDSLLYHAGSKFSTKDMDQDEWPEGSCAQAHSGAWWYRSCDMSNLNGRYLKGDVPEDFLYQGMYWGDFHGARYSLAKARMLVRPRD